MMDIILTTLGYILGIILLCFMAYGCWVSTVILSNRSKLRKITGAYYDHEIEKALQKMGKTQEEVLEELNEQN